MSQLAAIKNCHLPFAGRKAVDGELDTTRCYCHGALAIFDSYLIRYPEGSEIPPHTDQVTTGRHYRLNIILKSPREGGEFICAKPIFATRRIKLFRPDACEHSVTRVVGGNRYVFSLGWVRKGAG